MVGKRVFLSNEGAADVNIAAGTTIAGYYKGSFHMKGGKGKKAEEELEVRETDCQYILEDSSSEVLSEGKLTTMGKIIAQKRALRFGGPAAPWRGDQFQDDRKKPGAIPS